MGATLIGNVGLSDGNATNLVLRFFTPNTTSEQFRAAAITDASGDFTVYGIPAGTYDVYVKGAASTSLGAEDKVFTDGNETTINFGTLVLGDINMDDWIEGHDYNWVYNNFGARGAAYTAGIRDNDWLMPQCPSPPPAGGACYGYITS